MSNPFRTISLGAGVQSSALLLMACKGVLLKPDAAIFSDTQWEPEAVYVHLEWLKEQASTAGIPVHVVSAGNLHADALSFRQHRKSSDGKRWASIPLFVRNGDGSQGMLRRQCTKEYKIQPVQRAIRELVLGVNRGHRVPKDVKVEQWIGISWDERTRMTRPKHSWSIHVYPFCNTTVDRDGHGSDPNLLQGRWTRARCIEWLQTNYPDHAVPRSACIGCPYRSNQEWRSMRDTDPAAWADAVEFDRGIRESEKAGLDAGVVLIEAMPFVHRSMKPLDQVDLSPEHDATFWDGIADNKCEGMCGV